MVNPERGLVQPFRRVSDQNARRNVHQWHNRQRERQQQRAFGAGCARKGLNLQNVARAMVVTTHHLAKRRATCSSWPREAR